MVQIIEENRRPSRGERFASAINQGLSQALQVYGQKRQQERLAEQQQQQYEQENESIRGLTGFDPSGIRDPKMRQKLLELSLEKQFSQSPEDKFRQEQQRIDYLKQKELEKQKALSDYKLGQKKSYLDEVFGKSQPSNSQKQAPFKLDDVDSEASFEGYNPSKFTDEQIARATAMDPALGRDMRAAKDSALTQQREDKKSQEKKDLLTRKEEVEISKPILLELNQSRKNIPLQEQAIEDIKNASPDVGALDYIADVTGFEPLRSASGTKLKTAIKDFFLSDLSRAGARPNMWIEQQLADALPKLGRSKEANLITAEGMQFKVDLAKKRVELIDELAEKDKKKYGYVKGDIDSRASKLMRPYVEDRKKELQEAIKKIKSEKPDEEKPAVRMMSPDGEVWDIQPSDVEEAQENGFTFT